MALASKAFFPFPGPNPIGLLKEGDDDEILKDAQDFLRNRGKYKSKLVVKSNDELFLYRKSLDVVEYFKEMGVDHLVTNKDVKVSLENLRNKFVVIGCFSVPLISGFQDAAVCHALIALSHELTVRRPDSCVFILVIVVRKYTRDQATAFNHFFSGFPDNFLAIPVDYRQARESVCLYLSETDLPNCNGAIILVILLPYADTYSGEISADVVLSCLVTLTGDNKPTGLPPSIYPFTREMLCKKRLASLKQVTLLSLLKKFQVLECQGGHPTPLSELQNKNVLLYLNPYNNSFRGLFELDCEKRLKPYKYILPRQSCQWVCVFSGVKPGDDYVSKLPWLMVTPAEEASELLLKELILEQSGVKGLPWVIAFAEDGSVCSRRVFEGPDAYSSLFTDKLEKEIFHEVTYEVESKIR